MPDYQKSVTAEFWLGNHFIVVLYGLSKTSLSSWTDYLISVRERTDLSSRWMLGNMHNIKTPFSSVSVYLILVTIVKSVIKLVLCNEPSEMRQSIIKFSPFFMFLFLLSNYMNHIHQKLVYKSQKIYLFTYDNLCNQPLCTPSNSYPISATIPSWLITFVLYPYQNNRIFLEFLPTPTSNWPFLATLVAISD